jgi:hypothetical protein
MISFMLNPDNTYAVKIIDNNLTGEWHNIETSEEYLAWVAEGNEAEEWSAE